METEKRDVPFSYLHFAKQGADKAYQELIQLPKLLKDDDDSKKRIMELVERAKNLHEDIAHEIRVLQGKMVNTNKNVGKEDKTLYLPVNPDLEWHHSQFPDELVTLDFTKDGKLIGVEAIGSPARNAGKKMPPKRDAEDSPGPD